jgi:hypothetical protein
MPFISASHVQVIAGKVCNRQVGDLAGVNVLWDAEIIGMTSAFNSLRLMEKPL